MTRVIAQVRKLCGRAREDAAAYRSPGGDRTSKLLDRVLRSLNRYLEDSQQLHGPLRACRRHGRAWALLDNFRPWHPATAKANGGYRRPAERLNQQRYWEDGLPNLLIAASMAGYRR